MDACPNQQTLRDFLARKLDESRMAEVAEHVGRCEHCAKAVTAGEPYTTTAGEPHTTPVAAQGNVGEAARSARGEARQEPCPEDLSSTKGVADDHGKSLSDLELGFLAPSTNQDVLGRIGNYDVLAIVGRGGMGIVLKAFDASLHRVVAVKVLAPELASSSKARRRFVREARAAAAINHPNVITIHAVDEQNGMPYLVMEYVSGCTLRERIQRSPALEMVEVLRIGAQIASGLSAAHEQGVIHRDIKPSNVMLEDNVGRVKIADFGLARAAMDLSDITSLGQAVGTPAYISPEQVVGRQVDARSDLFSLGCLLYALFTGRSPFRGRTTLEVIRQVADHHPTNLTKVDSRVTPSLAGVIQRLLEKDPGNRFQSASEVAALLTSEIASLNQMPSDKMLNLDQTRRPTRWRFRLLAIAAGAAAVVGAFVWQARHVPPVNDDYSEKQAPALPSKAAKLRVAKEGRADCRTINAALQRAVPGSVIEVVDAGPYEETISIDEPERWQGISLVATRRALIQAPSGGARGLIIIADTPDVTVRGFRFRPLSEQHAIHAGRNVEGLTIENVESQKEATSLWAHVLLSDRAPGIAIRGSVFDGGTLGIVLLGAKNSPLKRIRVERNRFNGTGMHVQVLQSVDDVQVVGNIFNGGCGVYLSLQVPDGSRNVLVANNTFFGTSPWLGLGGSSPRQKKVVVANNLILGRDEIDAQDLASYVSAWSFTHNWYEAGVAEPAAVAERQESVELVSRDPSSPEFLRPAGGSSLANSGAGGDLPDYIGARPPAQHD